MCCRLRIWRARLALQAKYLTVPTEAAPPDFDLVLRDGVCGNTVEKYGTKSILFDLRHDGERWERVFGYAGSYNTSPHYGQVTSFEDKDGKIAIGLLIRIMPDGYRRDTGYATYDITLEKGEGDSYTGAFKATCLGNELIEPMASQRTNGPIECRQRLGGLLKYYHRNAAA